MSTRRKSWRHLSLAAVLPAAVALAACWCLAAGPAAAEELRIGYLAPMTGPFAQTGKDMTDGFKMYLDEVHNKFGGADVKLIIEDTTGKPDVAVEKAQKLSRQDHVQIMVGGVLATEGYALAPVSTREKVVYLVNIAAADDLTQREKDKFPYLVRTGWNSSMVTHPLGQWACENGFKRVSTVAADYAFGHETVGGFQRSFEDCGGKIVQKIWPPLNTIDFGPFLSQLKRDVDGVFTLMVGQMVLQFPKQYKAQGFSKPLLGGGTSADEFMLPNMGDEALGYTTALIYSAALNTPKVIAFVKKYRTLYNKVPSYYSESGYSTALWAATAMTQLKGQWPGPEQFVKTMAGIKLDTVRGPVHLDSKMNPVENVYIRRVERKKMYGYPNDELWNTVIKTYPNVDQFWKWGETEFLKQPVYSRDFPPCKFCE